MAAMAKPLTEFPLFAPPPRRWQGPIVDAHMHAKDVASMQAYFDVAQKHYGIAHALVIIHLDAGLELKKQFGSRVRLAVWPKRYDNLKDHALFRNENEAHLEQIAESGERVVKLWFTPRFHDRTGLRMDDPLFDFLFERISRLGLSVLVHVADPDYWFNYRINDLEQHGSKAEHFVQLLARMEQYPETIFQGAHFGGDPEDLDHLADLFERYPNYYVDSSATKWVAREFSRHGRAARDFLVRYQDRVLFGSDLVANPERDRHYYATRLWVHQMMWEQKGRFDSPIDDDDSSEPPSFQGLHVPEAVLAKLYWGNAARLYGFKGG